MVLFVSIFYPSAIYIPPSPPTRPFCLEELGATLDGHANVEAAAHEEHARGSCHLPSGRVRGGAGRCCTELIRGEIARNQFHPSTPNFGVHPASL